MQINKSNGIFSSILLICEVSLFLHSAWMIFRLEFTMKDGHKNLPFRKALNISRLDQQIHIAAFNGSARILFDTKIRIV